MCGRFYLEITIDELVERYEIGEHDQISYLSGEIFPTSKVPIVINDGVKKLVESKWDYPIPGINKTNINARVETLAEKASFLKSLYNRRCIIPANAFFEWQGEGIDKTKFKITKNGESVFSMAGIYNLFIDKERNPYLGFVIITKEATETISKLHHRMPLILNQEYENFWLDNSINSKKDLEELTYTIKSLDIDLRVEAIKNKEIPKQLSFIQ
jgi:putative SOS response-associated peptidase YedK